MPKKFSQRAESLRRAVAEEAARLMSEHGIGDFLQAKRKAADRLGVHDVAALPKNTKQRTTLRREKSVTSPSWQNLFTGEPLILSAQGIPTTIAEQTP